MNKIDVKWTRGNPCLRLSQGWVPQPHCTLCRNLFMLSITATTKSKRLCNSAVRTTSLQAQECHCRSETRTPPLFISCLILGAKLKSGCYSCVWLYCMACTWRWEGVASIPSGMTAMNHAMLLAHAMACCHNIALLCAADMSSGYYTYLFVDILVCLFTCFICCLQGTIYTYKYLYHIYTYTFILCNYLTIFMISTLICVDSKNCFIASEGRDV